MEVNLLCWLYSEGSCGVHTMLKKCKDAALFLRLGLLSTLICHETSNWRNLKTLGFCFQLEGKHFQREAFRKRHSYNNHVSFLPVFSSNPKPKLTVIVEILNCSGAVWTVNMMRFHRSLRFLFEFPPRIWLVSRCIEYKRVKRERERSKSQSPVRHSLCPKEFHPALLTVTSS